ncbi:MAG: PaaI family thioesterase [Calditrichaeota bacterium]|nr:MAG: PaaI family thioesterase [Calditrichota bacterium]
MDYKQRVSESFNRQGFMNFIGAKLEKIELGDCEIIVPFSENLTQQHGFFHAGVVATVADNVAGYSAFSLMDSTSSILTVEFKINLVAPAKGDFLIGKAKVIKQGKTLTICQSEVFAGDRENPKLCAVAQVTLMELRNREDQ